MWVAKHSVSCSVNVATMGAAAATWGGKGHTCCLVHKWRKENERRQEGGGGEEGGGDPGCLQHNVVDVVALQYLAVFSVCVCVHVCMCVTPWCLSLQFVYVCMCVCGGVTFSTLSTRLWLIVQHTQLKEGEGKRE